MGADTEEQLAEPEADRPRRGARPSVIVAATMAAVVAITFLIYSVGDYKGGDLAGGGVGGSWKLALTVAEPGKPAVSVPLSLEVAAISPN